MKITDIPINMHLKIKRLFILIFIIINLFGIVYYNSPQRIKKITSKIFPSLKVIPRYVSSIGITGNWRMFTSLERENWWVVIKGIDEKLNEIIFPLPLQSKRTFLEEYFFDFKEVKFILILLKEKYRQKHYAIYLCKKFPVVNGQKIETIIYESYEQNKYRPKEACKNGYYIEPVIKRTIINTYNCKDICK